VSSIYVGPEELHTIETLESQLHCPRCTALFATNGFSSAFWQADEIIYFSSCGECGWLGDITEITHFVSYERDEATEAEEF
jgi:predicted metal-binding protein